MEKYWKSSCRLQANFDGPIEEMKKKLGRSAKSKFSIPVRTLSRNQKPKKKIESVREVVFDGMTIRELETGTIEVEHNGKVKIPAKPHLRKLAAKLGLDIMNDNGNPRNTRQLGSLIIKIVQEKQSNAQ